jgi:hypothetical protein
MGENKNAYRVLVRKKERPLGRPRWIILKLILKRDGVAWTGFVWMEAFCAHGNEPLGSITFWKDLEYLLNWRALQMASASWRWLS